LERSGARATVFLVGEQVLRRPELAAEIASPGPEIGVHCQRHRLQARLGPRQLRDDMRRGAASIEDASGRTPTLYRPPYGIFSLAGLIAVRRCGWLAVHWSRDTKDWRAEATPDSILRRATDHVRSGEVVLMHDADHYGAGGSWQRTAAALPGPLERLSERGLATVLLSHGTR
jgi:peptidoglycan/xylan/chitin deacetylase (PgdA/CDA1 family)